MARDTLAPVEIRIAVSRKGIVKARREADAAYRLKGLVRQQMAELREQNRARRSSR